MNIEGIEKYFPFLTDIQRGQFARMQDLYEEWNGRINVISRKDMSMFAERHVLHSLALAKVCTFSPGARVLDVGCGGGLPGIPLAVLFPQTQFTLVDSIGKKIKVVSEVASALELKNITALHSRAETLAGRFDYVVSRAVTDMEKFIPWIWDKIDAGNAGSCDNGILYLKGGDLKVEMNRARKKYRLYDVADFFEGDFFLTKKVVYIPKNQALL